MKIINIPLSVYNRALEIYGEPPETSEFRAGTALHSADSRIDLREGPALRDGTLISPLAQAMAEYMSLSGPWGQVTGQHAEESGFEIAMSSP
jgi:hypothetical protein